MKFTKVVKAYHKFTNKYNSEQLNNIQEYIGKALDEASQFNNSIKYEDKWNSLSNEDREKLIKAGEYLYKMLWKSRNVLKDIDTLFNGSDTPEGSIDRSTLPFELKRYK